MLETLRIKNIAIIDFAEIHFKSGLNILSGETGAGKSIIIASISLLLGSRASTELIRAECEEATVEGLFCISDMPWMTERLNHHGFKSSEELLIKRTVNRSGKHRISVNGELATLSTLQSLCDGLIDLCSQHEHQSLTKSSTQLDLLDRFGKLTEQAKNLSDIISHYKHLKNEFEQIQKTETDRIRRADFLKFQIHEIQEAELVPDEDIKLQEEKQLLISAENRIKIAETARQNLESEDGALHCLRSAFQKLKHLSQLDSSIPHLQQGLERGLAEVEDVAIELNRYLSSIDLNPERISIVQDRLSLIADLKRKYTQSGGIQEILDTFDTLATELSSLERADTRLAELQKELETQEKDLKKLGASLSQARKKAAQTLGSSVTKELQDLKMSESKFIVETQYSENIEHWNACGGDSVQYLAQTNAGEPARPIGKIASGGELSRLLLSIRRVIANRGGIGVYLFDEIDAGMGGQTAFQVGKKLKSVAQYNQVICITHLPQVASFANHHWVVQKSTQGKRTLTEIKELQLKDRTQELARMLGGPGLTRKNLENASELLELANSI